jgi:DNA polymerase III subunit alpha
MNDFVHLHVHSEYSLLDGYAATGAICARAAELGMDSIALTDHGVMYGAMEFYAAAKKANIKPIIGVEAYMAPGARTEPMTRGGKNYYHLLLLAKNETGYRNLVKLTTRAHLDGMGRGVFARPRIDRELLAQHHEGLIVTSSCIAGEVIQHLTNQQKDKAREVAAWHRDLLGDRYYLELQRHENTPELDAINDELVRIGSELGIPLVVTNDTHFVRREDLEAQKMVMSMGMGMTMAEFCTKGYVMDESYHIMAGDEMWQRFKQYGTAPLENTRRIADECNLKLDFGRVQLPAFEIPEGHDAASYLRFVCEEGLMKRFDGAPPDDYVQRLHYELDVINQTGFPDYMLIVWDYVKYARSRGIPCLPRGSAGASLVLYTLGITDVDPVKNKLLFERFLSPERLEMPDIDTDFADSRRHEILDYIAGKYGRENVAQIITYGTLGAKAALRDVGRVLDYPLSEVDKVAKLIPMLPVGTTIAQALERVPELKQIYDGSPEMKKLIDWAQKVEGRMKSVGTHACGVVVSRNPLEELVPLQRTTKDENAAMAAYEGPTLAKIGLLKMDILGLANLSIVAEALNYIEQTTGQRIELANIPLDDRKTFESLSRGETTNVFQLESPGMTKHLVSLKPTRVDDLYAMVALYRPGPLEQIPNYVRNKNNPREIKYLHPILKPILEDTYGVIVYQEQIMQLLQAIAGYTLGQAYIVLKAIGKKNKQLMAEEEPRFKAGCLKNGLSKAQADELWDLIQPFAGYSFNRPHSTLYGLLSYQTAWLKTNHPTEYMAAVLSSCADQIEDVAKSVAECGRLGVAVLPADINCSELGFTIEQLPAGQLDEYANRRGIRFGLSAIKTVGSGPVQAIIDERRANGPFVSLESFCDRVHRQFLNKRVLEALIKCGAMDSLPGTRRQKLAILDQALGAGSDAQKARESGQSSMFDFMGDNSANNSAVSSIPLPIIRETQQDYKEQLGWEKELLGMYVSAHPVAQALQGIDLDALGATTLGRLSEENVGQTVCIVGMLTQCRRLTTKKGDAMMVCMVEDIDSTIEMVVFPKGLDKFQTLLRDDAVLKISAKVDNRRDQLQLMLESAEDIADVYTSPPPPPDEVLTAPAAPEPPVAAPREEAPMAITTLAATPSAPPPAEEAAAAPAEPTAADAPTVTLNAIRTRQRVQLASKPTEETAPAPSGPTTTLHIHLPRSDDFDADVLRMQEIEHLLSAYEGGDQVTLYIPNGIGVVRLRPHRTVTCNPALLAGLKELVGEDAVEVA